MTFKKSKMLNVIEQQDKEKTFITKLIRRKDKLYIISGIGLATTNSYTNVNI